MILSGQTIRRLGIITPCCERTVAHGMSYGLGPAGYDVRVREGLILQPQGFSRVSVVEHMALPNDVMGWIADKSSWVRQGLCVQNSKAEPGWRGYLTLELTNHSDQPITLVSGMPIAQVVFMRLDEPAETPYGDGKYQDQPPRPVAAIKEPE